MDREGLGGLTMGSVLTWLIYFAPVWQLGVKTAYGDAIVMTGLALLLVLGLLWAVELWT